MLHQLYTLYSAKWYMNANDELGRTRKKAVVAYLKVLYWHLPGETEENYKTRRFGGLQAGSIHFIKLYP